MKAKIKKGVRPFSGRTFPVVEIKEFPGKPTQVMLDVGKRPQFGVYVSDVRIYQAHELTFIKD